jgi:hypothetical protein
MISRHVESFAGQDIHNFHRLRNQGVLLPHTHFEVTQDYEWSCTSAYPLKAGFTASNGVLVEYRWSHANANFHSAWHSPTSGIGSVQWAHELISSSGIDLRTLVQEAASRVYSRGWDGLTFLAELRQVASMFRRIGPRIIEILRTAKKAWKQEQYRGLWKSFDDYLQARYGWRVLLYDMQDLYRLVKTFDEEKRTRVKDRSIATRDIETEVVNISTGGHVLTKTHTSTYAISCRGGLICDFMPAKISINPFITAWELIPYSFVIDWFVGVGRALAALSLTAISQKTAAYHGFRIDVGKLTTVSPSAGDSTWQNGFHSNFDSVVVTEKWTHIQRQPSSIPLLPRLDVRLDFLKVLDLVALVIQSARR